MKYIGNKTRILKFIEECLRKEKIEFKGKIIVDLFAGTGSVSNFFLRNNCIVYACDNMTYSIAEQYRVNYYSKEPLFGELNDIIGGDTLDDVLYYLNQLKPIKDYFFENFAPSGKYKRQFFTDNNAQKIDSIRFKLKEWEALLPKEKNWFLLGILMNSADRVSNTAGTYGAYLKIWRTMALKDLVLEKPEFVSTGKVFIVQDDVLNFVKENKNFDIVYLDPPYNERQYASNFHVLESIVVYDKQKLKGKTGLRNYDSQKSDFCIAGKVKDSFEKLIKNLDTKYIVMSYSNEGLLSKDYILKILRAKGTVTFYENDYKRFKTNAWTNDNTGLKEIIFICKVFEKGMFDNVNIKCGCTSKKGKSIEKENNKVEKNA